MPARFPTALPRSRSSRRRREHSARLRPRGRLCGLPTLRPTRHPVSIDTSVLDSSGQRVSRQSLREASFTGRQADVRLGLPLKTLPPGRYILQVDAKQGRAEASRSIAFSVAQAQPSFTQEHSPELDAALAAAAALHRTVRAAHQRHRRRGTVRAGDDRNPGAAGRGVCRSGRPWYRRTASEPSPERPAPTS